MTTAIWWIRRDMRLTDNQALTQALQQADHVIPLFIIDPTLLASPYLSNKRLAFLYAGLRHLAADLQAIGGGLLIRRGQPTAVLRRLMAESSATLVVAEADVSPYARRRDAAVSAALPLQLTEGLTIRPPVSVLKTDGTPYTVFTPFSRTWHSLPLPTVMLPAPTQLPALPALPTDPLPIEPLLPDNLPFTPGERAARQRLRQFVARATLDSYAEQRNRMDIDGTSQLSPYLRHGMISARELMVTAYHAQQRATTETARIGATTWLNELIWRDFYSAILYHFPHVRRGSFRPQFEHIAWRNHPAEFAAWCAGQTGYPVVDAAMRQLLALGWMHNRARMIVASFLVKHLLIDWRWGERWFMQHLLDGDPAANNGGWQWSAGTGTDAAPYFRVFNPILQSRKFDPEGAYIRRWVPELATVPDTFIHTPWQMPAREQQAARCVIGRDYPPPIVEHTMARQRVLAVYQQAKGM